MLLIFVAAALLVGLLGLSVLIATVAFVARAALFLVLLPFRLIFLAIGLPFVIVGAVLALVLAVVGGSLLIGAGILAAVLSSALLPLTLVVLAVWALVRFSRRPAAA